MRSVFNLFSCCGARNNKSKVMPKESLKTEKLHNASKKNSTIQTNDFNYMNLYGNIYPEYSTIKFNNKIKISKHLKFDDFKIKIPSETYQLLLPDIQQSRIEYLNKIRETIKNCKLENEDKSDEAILEFSKNSAYIPTSPYFRTPKQNMYEISMLDKENFYTILIKFIKNELNLDNEPNNKKIIKALNNNLDKLNIYLAKQGFRCIKKFKDLNNLSNIRQIPKANEENLLQNKRIKLLKNLSEKTNETIANELNTQYQALLKYKLITKKEYKKLKVNNKTAVLKSTYLSFQDLYTNNNKPKDLKTILHLVDYYITGIFPAAAAEFSQDLIHNGDNSIIAHYLPEMSIHNKSSILPLETAIASGVGVCHQKALLTKYLLTELKKDYPDLDYSKIKIETGIITDGSEQYLHHSNSILNKNQTIKFEFDSFFHNVFPINLDIFDENYQTIEDLFFENKITDEYKNSSVKNSYDFNKYMYMYRYNSFKDEKNKKVILNQKNIII